MMPAAKRRGRAVARRTAAELDKLKAAGQIVGETLALVRQQIVAGVTGVELDRLAEEHIRTRGAVPSFKGYRGYPAATCIEVDDIVVHGIPNEMPLKPGQIVGVDMGAYYQGFHGDATICVVVGEADAEQERLLEAVEGSLRAGMGQAWAGKQLQEISKAIEGYAQARGYSIVQQLVGHGIGQEMHEPPQIPNFFSTGEFADYEIVLQPGMILAIEPMVNAGSPEVRVDDDGWTVRTADGGPSVHLEHTIAVTESEPLILTLAEGAKYLSDA